MKKTIKLSDYICCYLLYIIAFVILSPLCCFIQLLVDIIQSILAKTVKKHSSYEVFLDNDTKNGDAFKTDIKESSKNYTCCNCISRYSCLYAFNTACVDGDCLMVQ